ncbi:MAG TPA: hypothetical protein VGI81_03450 [Tepidisphaeraceae bacterium]|jgi:hypothetical protein
MQYVLYVQIDGQWVETDRFHAEDNVDAFKQSVQRLDPEYHGCPIAFARVESARIDMPVHPSTESVL